MSSKSYAVSDVKNDIVSSIVVFLVAIPLCLGIALASGAPLFSGIIAGVIGGIVVGLLSQSHVSVSGPAAGMVAVVLTAIAQLGGFQAFLLALMFAGIIQIIIGMFRAGFIADYIPSNVIQGLLAAIGILIILKQIPLAFGYFAQAGELHQTLKVAQEQLSFTPISHVFSHISKGATLITLISLALLIYGEVTKNKLLKIIPGPVIVVIAGIVINALYLAFFPKLALYTTHLVTVPVNDSIQGFFSQLKSPDFSIWTNPNVYLYAAMIAIVASLETLLNLEAAEKLDKRRRYCSRNRELIAQGIGNTLSGLIGGIPITSVVVRSSVNIQAGSRSKLSTILHGAMLLIAVATIPEWLNMIPLASLAGILIFTGYKLTKVSLFKKMYEEGFAHFFPFLVTVIAIVTTNLLFGIIIGLIVSIFFILRYNSKNCFDIIDEKHAQGSILRVVLPQQVSFLSKAAFIQELACIPKDSKVVFDATFSDYIDYDIMELIHDYKDVQAPDKDINVNLTGFKKHYDVHDHIDFISVTTNEIQTTLSQHQVLDLLKEGNQRFLQNRFISRDFQKLISATSECQHPLAVIIGCIDSRVPVELVFDVAVGDVFCVRVAGNIINDDILASVEFACKVAGAKLIMVLGHSSCGAIKAACDSVQLGHLTQLVKKIEPAIAAEKETQTDRTSNNEQFVNNVAKNNIELSKEGLCQHSPILKDMIDANDVGLIGALYDVSTGKVRFDAEFYTPQ